MIVVAAHLDNGCAGKAIDNQFHDRCGLLEFAAVAATTEELGITEDAGRTDDHRVLTRIQRYATETIGNVSSLHVATTHEVLNNEVRRDNTHLLFTQAISGLHDRRCISRAEDADELSGIDEADNVSGSINLGRLQFRIRHHGRNHRVATRHRVLGTGKRQDRTIRTGSRDTVKRVMRIVAGVVVRTGGNNCAVQLNTATGTHAGFHAALEGAVRMEGQSEVGIGIWQTRNRIVQSRDHVARQAELVVACGTEEIHLAAFPADQYVRARDIDATGKVEADERYFSGAAKRYAAAGRIQVTRQCR